MIDSIQPPRVQPQDKHILEKNMKTKPFNLEAAMNGAKLVTRDGREAKFIAHVPENYDTDRVAAVVGGVILPFHENGRRFKDGGSLYDLFLAVATRSINGHEYPEPLTEPPKHRQWVFMVDFRNDHLSYCFEWDESNERHHEILNAGLVHGTRGDTQAHARAIILAGGGEV